MGEKGEKNRRGRTVKAVMQTLGFALIGSLGPGSTVGEKGKKRRQIRTISASEGYLASQAFLGVRHAFLPHDCVRGYLDIFHYKLQLCVGGGAADTHLA